MRARLSLAASAIGAMVLTLGMHVPATAVAATDGFCFDSTPYGDLRGTGVYISECDLQALENGGSVYDLLSNIAGLKFEMIHLMNIGLEGQLIALKSIDQGNGVYLLTPLVGQNAPIMYAR